MAVNEEKKPVPEDKKPAVAKAADDSRDWTKPLPVALVQFDRPIQYPGRQSETHAKTEQLSNGRRWMVEYLAPIRHFRITFIDPDRKVSKVGYVHEVRALSWEPIAA